MIDLEVDPNKQAQFRAVCEQYINRAEELAPPSHFRKPVSPRQSDQHQHQQAAGVSSSKASDFAKLDRRASCVLKEAHELHTERKFYEAKKQYELAVELHLQAAAMAPSPGDKIRLKQSAETALSRAEQLKSAMYGDKPHHTHHSPQPPPQRRASPASSPQPARRPVDPGEGLTDAEQKVLENTSYINRRCYVPWLDVSVIRLCCCC